MHFSGIARQKNTQPVSDDQKGEKMTHCTKF